MWSAGDSRIAGDRPRRNVVIEQMGTSETIPAPDALATQRPEDSFVFLEPDNLSHEPPRRTFWQNQFRLWVLEPIKFFRSLWLSIGRVMGRLIGGGGIGAAVRAEAFPPELTVRSRAGATMTVIRRDNEILLRSPEPFDLANLFEIMESEGRSVHAPLSWVTGALMTFPLQSFTIAQSFSVTPAYNSFTHLYDVSVRPLNDSVSVDRIYASLREFEKRTETEIVDRVETSNASGVPRLADILRTLTHIFESELRRYADRLGVDKDSGDARLRGMLHVESMIAESATQDVPLDESMRVLEVGVRENSEGEITAFIVRFVKNYDFGSEVNRNNVVTWKGVIDQSTGKITWYYHEIVGDSAYVANPISPAFLTTRTALKQLIPQTSWDHIRYGVELDSAGGGGENSGGPTPGSPATPAAPAGQAPEVPPSTGGPAASALAYSEAPIYADVAITAAFDEYSEITYEGYTGGESSYDVYVDCEDGNGYEASDVIFFSGEVAMGIAEFSPL